MAAPFKAFGRDEGEALWSAGSLMIIKAASEDTHGGLTVIEQTCPPGLDPPPHVHDTEEQCLYMLAGSIELTCGDVTNTLNEGSFAILPRGVAHSFKVGPDGARFLSLTTPAGFEKFARDIGEPATSLVPPAGGVVPSDASIRSWTDRNQAG
jgi:quercetin dioxygenase-like cupin family protein